MHANIGRSSSTGANLHGDGRVLTYEHMFARSRPWRRPPHSAGRSRATRRRRPSSTTAFRPALATCPPSSTCTCGRARSSAACPRSRACPSATRSTRTAAARTPACTASRARRTRTSISTPARTSSERSSSRSTRSSASAPSCAPPKWSGDHIAMGTNTDPYQPAEGRYRLTRGLIDGALRGEEPVLDPHEVDDDPARHRRARRGVAKRTTVGVSFSIGTLDERAWRTSEPGTPPPRQRVEALRRLVDAGIECGVLVAPVLPGISDAPEQLEEVVGACLAAGATSISSILLHLRPGVRELYLPWLQRERPDLVAAYDDAVRLPLRLRAAGSTARARRAHRPTDPGSGGSGVHADAREVLRRVVARVERRDLDDVAGVRRLHERAVAEVHADVVARRRRTPGRRARGDRAGT